MATSSLNTNSFEVQPVLSPSAATCLDVETSQARNSINQSVRNSTSGGHIFELPDEVLVAIFRHESGTKTIQNARLTCRRFRETSSEFLITTVWVELSHDSLAEFRNIMSHPTFGKGVVTVNVQLATYDDRPVGSFSRFLTHHINRLMKWHTLMDPPGAMQSDTPENSKLRSIIESWRVMSYRQRHENDVPLEEDTDWYQNLILRAFIESQRRHAEERELLESGAFVAQIASAMTGKLQVRSLVFGDQDRRLSGLYDNWFPPEDQLADDEKLRKTLCNNVRVPYCYRSGQPEEEPISPDAVPVIPGLLAALGAADIRITCLDINLSFMPDFTRLRPAVEDDQAKIRSAVGDLRRLKICTGYEASLSRSRDEHQVVTKFVAQLINVNKLESMFVQLKSWSRDVDPMFMDSMFMDTTLMQHIDSVKLQTAWSNLHEIGLYNLASQCSDLERLLRSMKSSKLSTTIRLYKIHLLGGSWVSILDILRERHSLASLVAPSGGECESMGYEEYNIKFGSYYQDDQVTNEDTEVARYIRGTVAVNPLLPLPELEPNA